MVSHERYAKESGPQRPSSAVWQTATALYTVWSNLYETKIFTYMVAAPLALAKNL